MRSIKTFMLAATAAIAVAALPASAMASGEGLSVGGAETGVFEASQYPAHATGGIFEAGTYKSPFVLLEAAGEQVTCGNVELDQYGSGLGSKPASRLYFQSTFSECGTSWGSSATVETGEVCLLRYDELAYLEEDAYSANTKLLCSIEINVAGCILEIPPQTLGGGESVVGNVDSEGEATVGALTIANGVDFTASSLCKLVGISKGSHEDGHSKYGMQLRAEF